MELTSFRVTDFRSIQDTGWIDASRVTALIGTNESGKSNILLALWKLKPVRDGNIDLLADIPRSQYHVVRKAQPKPIFIQAKFEFAEEEAVCLSKMTSSPREEMDVAKVTRSLDDKVSVSFPNATIQTDVEITSLGKVLSAAREQISALNAAGSSEEPYKRTVLEAIRRAEDSISRAEDKLSFVHEVLGDLAPKKRLKNSEIVPAFEVFMLKVAANLVYELIPSFVYYANYGNLDSEIYLPHVIENMQRDDLSGAETAKTRTLRILFEFVKLKPSEILDLGRETGVEEEQIQLDARNKKEREVLLQSASTSLTRKFRDWWKQGNHKFRFQADGNHFRIWVSDDIRLEEVELEGRSAGLQWFLSFFLVFLVESAEAHKNAILLLDEPGVSLHPIAQRDLFKFFDTLSEGNQVFYTSHSPFLVNADQLDRVRSVYFDEEGDEKGLTKVSADLRAKEKATGQINSIYPVHAALGISVSESLLLGSTQIIVEGTSDQFYLSAIKTYLIGQGLIQPKRELLFLPTGGVSGIKAVVPIIAGKDGKLPAVLLDGDYQGKQVAANLKKNLYEGCKDQVISLSEVCGIADAEVEDLIPTDIFSRAVRRCLKNAEEDFEAVKNDQKPHVKQVEDFADKYDVDLPAGWKVEVAKHVKRRMLQNPDLITASDDIVEKWKTLFERFCTTST